MRKTTKKKCKVCKEPFIAKRKDAKFCGGNCRFQAHYIKKKKEDAKLLKEWKQSLKENAQQSKGGK